MFTQKQIYSQLLLLVISDELNVSVFSIGFNTPLIEKFNITKKQLLNITKEITQALTLPYGIVDFTQHESIHEMIDYIIIYEDGVYFNGDSA